MMEKYYIVEVVNDLTLAREHWHMESDTAQGAVDAVKEKFEDFSGYSVINVYVEVEEAWE
jgi:hypothetical protein